MKSKNRMLSVLAAASAVIIILFFAAEIYGIVGRAYTTQTAYEQTVMETVEAEMFVIRDESVLSTSLAGVTVPLAKNAERVSKGSSIAAVFSSEASAENYIKAQSLQAKLDVYKKIDSQLRLDQTDLDKLTGEINSDFASIVNASYNNDFLSVADYSLSFCENVSKKQILMGEAIDCSAKIAQLTSDIAALNSAGSPKEIIPAESAGYYVSQEDGYENILTVDDLDSLTEEKLKSAFDSKPKTVAASSIGKIISGHNWYIATIVDTAKVVELSSGDTVNLILGTSGNETVSARVFSSKAIDKTRSLIVFSCSLMNEELAQLRKINGRIVIDEHTGLKVDRDAIRLDENGDSGVFVRRGNIVNFRSLNIIYSEDSFVIAAKPSADSDIELNYTHLKLYDEIIISGKDLKDGMVIG